MNEARVRRVEEHTGRRERVQAEEAGRDEEREPDEEDARIPAPPGGFPRREREDDADGRDGEHEPEVARLVPPLEVRLRVAEQDRQADQGQHEQRGDDQHRERP
jgi:hypothetical protein